MKNQDTIDKQQGLTPVWPLFRYTWNASEHVFKLTAWMLVTSAVLALGLKSRNETVVVLGFALSIVWMAALGAALLRLLEFLQNSFLTKFIYPKKLHPFLTVILVTLLFAVTSFPLIKGFNFLAELFLEVVTDSGILQR